MILKDVLRNKLHQELTNAGIEAIVEAVDDTVFGGDFTFPEETNMDLVQQIINAHDPTPILPAPNEHEELLNYVLDLDMRMVMIEMGLI